MLPFLLIMSVMMILVIAIRDWWAHSKYLIPQQVAISEKSIQLASTDGTSILPWTTYTYYKETGRSYILWNSRTSQWLLLPKKAFSSSHDRDMCRSILARDLRLSRWFLG